MRPARREAHLYFNTVKVAHAPAISLAVNNIVVVAVAETGSHPVLYGGA